jgi:hypothetical protein
MMMMMMMMLMMMLMINHHLKGLKQAKNRFSGWPTCRLSFDCDVSVIRRTMCLTVMSL